jgi:hypothetical protein
MGDLIRRISKSLREFTGRETPEVPTERRRSTRFICSAPVVWEVGREQGEGELRELSASGMKLWTDRAILAGKHIRIRPLNCDGGGPLTVDLAIGKVVYSRARSRASAGCFEVGVELLNPDRISRFAWVGRLTRQKATKSPLPPVLPRGEMPRLSLIDCNPPLKKQGLLRSEFRTEK